MELSLELGIGSKRKKCQDMEDHQPFQRKKVNISPNIDEFLGRASRSIIGVECSELDLQPLTQTNTMNEFIFQPLPIDITLPNAWLESTCVLDRYIYLIHLFLLTSHNSFKIFHETKEFKLFSHFVLNLSSLILFVYFLLENWYKSQ